MTESDPSSARLGPAPKRQTTKRCHWVSQGYLRGFASDPPRRKVWRLSKHDDGGEPELKPIEKVAVRYYLYVPKDAQTGVPDDRMERKLSDLEQWFGGPLWQALCTDLPDFSAQPIRRMLALIVAVTYLRNPAHLEKYRQIHRHLVEAVTSMEALPGSFEHAGKTYPLDPESWPDFMNATPDDVQRMWLDELNSAAWCAQELLKMRWTILCATTPTFITSDNPVTFVHPSLQFRGAADPETMIIFPISPTRLLAMDHLHGEPADAYYQLQGDGAAQNLLLWRGANEYMFSARHPDEVCRDFVRATAESS